MLHLHGLPLCNVTKSLTFVAYRDQSPPSGASAIAAAYKVSSMLHIGHHISAWSLPLLDLRIQVLPSIQLSIDYITWFPNLCIRIIKLRRAIRKLSRWGSSGITEIIYFGQKELEFAWANGFPMVKWEMQWPSYQFITQFHYLFFPIRALICSLKS